MLDVWISREQNNNRGRFGQLVPQAVQFLHIKPAKRKPFSSNKLNSSPFVAPGIYVDSDKVEIVRTACRTAREPSTGNRRPAVLDSHSMFER